MAAMSSWGTGSLLIVAALNVFIVPTAAIVWTLWHTRSGRRHLGLGLGLVVGVWLSLIWHVVPYCGAYPNLPGLLVGWAIWGDTETFHKDLTVWAFNLLVWGGIGAIADLLRHVSRSGERATKGS